MAIITPPIVSVAATTCLLTILSSLSKPTFINPEMGYKSFFSSSMPIDTHFPFPCFD